MILLSKTRRAEARKKQDRLDRTQWWFANCRLWLVFAIAAAGLLLALLFITSAVR